MSLPKIRYVIDLMGATLPPRSGPVPGLRTIEPSDLEALAQLMLDAYAGTIDSEDETLQDAIDEVASYLDATPLLDHSFLYHAGGRALSAVLVSTFEGGPFIGYVITDPRHKRQGLATTVTKATLHSLRRAGHSRVVLYITEGNTPSERLFRRLGAMPDPTT